MLFGARNWDISDGWAIFTFRVSDGADVEFVPNVLWQRPVKFTDIWGLQWNLLIAPIQSAYRYSWQIIIHWPMKRLYSSPCMTFQSDNNSLWYATMDIHWNGPIRTPYLHPPPPTATIKQLCLDNHHHHTCGWNKFVYGKTVVFSPRTAHINYLGM